MVDANVNVDVDVVDVVDVDVNVVNVDVNVNVVDVNVNVVDVNVNVVDVDVDVNVMDEWWWGSNCNDEKGMVGNMGFHTLEQALGREPIITT